MENLPSCVGDPIPALAAVEDSSDDGCSICLEPFSSNDPATVTNCKHEYHLQCILEWSQRSKECPICWQLLALKDPESQELLAALETERSSRSSCISSLFRRMPPEDFEFHNVSSVADESDLDEHIMQHLAAAAAAGRVHRLRRREQHRSSAINHSQSIVSAAPNVPDEQAATSTENRCTGSSVSLEGETATVVILPVTVDQHQASRPISPVSMGSDDVDNMLTPSSRITVNQTPPLSPRRTRQSELLSFSESLKFKLSAASSRYKESISKSTRGFKEKLLARNNSVKELSREVQREVTAGIAGVARMFERLDPSSKRVSNCASASSGTVGISDSSPSGERVQENLIPSIKSGQGAAKATSSSSNVPVHASGAFPSQPGGFVGVSHVQDSI